MFSSPLPANGATILRFQVQDPDLMISRHGDKEPMAFQPEIPGAIQSGRPSCSAGCSAEDCGLVPVPAMVLTLWPFRSNRRIVLFLRSAT